MEESFAKLKDFVRKLSLEKEANRKLLDVVKEFESLHRHFEQFKLDVEPLKAELAKANARADAEATARRELEKEQRRLERRFLEYRQEAENESLRIVGILKKQWRNSARSDSLEPEWSLPDTAMSPEGAKAVFSDGYIRIVFGRIYVFQDNHFLGSPQWVLLHRNQCQCELVRDEFVVCERKLPDWELLHPQDRHRTVYAGYSLKRPIRLLSAYDRDEVLRRIVKREFINGEKRKICLEEGEWINVHLPSPLARLNPDFFTNRVHEASEAMSVVELLAYADAERRRRGDSADRIAVPPKIAPGIAEDPIAVRDDDGMR